MTPGFARLFESVSGWSRKEHFEYEHDGYVTLENDPKTRQRNAFLWHPDGSHERVAKMWLCGELFFRKGGP